MFHYMMLFNRQGKVRLSKWFTETAAKQRKRITTEVVSSVLARAPRQCNFIEWRDKKIVYKRYASLYFVLVADVEANELLSLEGIHLYVEALDKYFGNVCELDLIFHGYKANYILDEVLLGGFLQDNSRKSIAKAMAQQDALSQWVIENPGDPLPDVAAPIAASPVASPQFRG